VIGVILVEIIPWLPLSKSPETYSAELKTFRVFDPLSLYLQIIGNEQP